MTVQEIELAWVTLGVGGIILTFFWVMTHE